MPPMEQVTRPEFAWPHARWLDTDSVLVVDRIGAAGEELMTVERVQTREMSAARLREFSAGRAVARRALALLHEPANSGIPIGAGGEPVWPTGISGSVSHTATHAVALVARSARHASVGVDLDDRRMIGDAAAADLMTDQEIEAVLAQGWTIDHAIAQNIVFLAKEAVFKYQYLHTTRIGLDFNEVRLYRSAPDGKLHASPVVEDPSLHAVLATASIFYQEIQGLRICWVLTSG
jgi:4'-phosphopantetheinyl transferase EntD